MLILQDICKSFHHQGNVIEVLRGIDLIVNSGDTLAIMGASGVGKSTLLDIMGSLELPSGGVVKYKDQDIYEMDESSLCRFRNREIGFVFQFHHLLPEFNALENTLMPALIGGYDKKTAVGMAKEVLERVGLGKRLTHRTGQLSGGEQQRVAIARALIMKPKLILADEPTGNLDWLTGQEIADLLLSFSRLEGVAIVIATHNEKLAVSMSRQMEIISGRIS
ncbi:MAG: ABC transporter ATP-binding protein [Thermodesulfobacteriota bacterium]|nr:ABC transporter ATP-binding protein [Thermodesulfobacteriota bacterium]